MSTNLYPFPTPFLPLVFKSKSIEMLTPSEEVLVYYTEKWRRHFESWRAGDKLSEWSE